MPNVAPQEDQEEEQDDFEIMLALFEPEELDEYISIEEEALATQHQINLLTPWRFEGSTGRAMMNAINAGYCMLGLESTRDYYGNKIPSRFEVEPGTKGSREYVVSHNSEDWAKMLESVNP